MLLTDVGLRITECLTLSPESVDLQNMLLTVQGKGRRERIIPFSVEVRKIFISFLKHRNIDFSTCYLFCNRDGGMLDYPNLFRDMKKLLVKIGVDKSKISGAFHSFRHKAARAHLKNGGDVFSLKQKLGHARLTTTEIYIGEIETEEMHRIQQKVTLLSKRR
jgi:integrase/recombinase XerD